MYRENVAVIEVGDLYNDNTGNIELIGQDRQDFTDAITWDTNNPAQHYQVYGGLVVGPDDPATGNPSYKRAFDMRLQYFQLRAALDPVHARLSGGEYFLGTQNPCNVVDTAFGVSLKADHVWNLHTVTGETFDKAAGDKLYLTVGAFVPTIA